uniref:Uncharacterized protein n=1 Tax=Bracon brevicornis TaxID=1563983 RepID=A0A6V7HY48_9HYME
MAVAQVSFPQIEVFNRVLGLPVIEQALAVSVSTYSRVKDSNQLLRWFLSTAENSITDATKRAAPFAAPIAMKFEAPIHFFDDKLCWGLDKIEEKVPIVKDTPTMVSKD